MDNIQNFNIFVGNPVDNQVRVEDNVAVYAAFGCKVAAFGISSVIFGKRIQRYPYYLLVTLCLKISELV